MPGDRPGDWNPTPPAFLPALDPGWGGVRPFFLRSGSQFRPGPPPALAGRRYARDFEEIKAIGSSDSVSRTQDQTDLARFWISTAPQNWNPVARQAAIAQGLTLSENARALRAAQPGRRRCVHRSLGCEVHVQPVAAADSHSRGRHRRQRGHRRRSAMDAAARHASLSRLHRRAHHYAGAAEKVLEHVFGAEPGVVITLTSATAPGVVETYTAFKDIADGVVDARVWGGIHWRTSSVRGRTVGEAIGRYAVRHFLRARDDDDDPRGSHHPPR